MVVISNRNGWASPSCSNNKLSRHTCTWLHPTAIVTNMHMYKSILVDKTLLMITQWAYPYVLCHVLDRNARNDSIWDLSLWINHTEIATRDCSVKASLTRCATPRKNYIWIRTVESASKPNTEVTSLWTWLHYTVSIKDILVHVNSVRSYKHVTFNIKQSIF